jgi:hypothetical protein
LGRGGTGDPTSPETLLRAIERVMQLAVNTVWPPTSVRKTRARKKLLDTIRYRLIDLKEFAPFPEFGAEAGQA